MINQEKILKKKFQKKECLYIRIYLKIYVIMAACVYINSVFLHILRWLWRQRIRVHLEGTGINPTPVDLHEQQLSLEQHSQAHRITTNDVRQSTKPVRLSLSA